MLLRNSSQWKAILKPFMTNFILEANTPRRLQIKFIEKQKNNLQNKFKINWAYASIPIVDLDNNQINARALIGQSEMLKQ